MRWALLLLLWSGSIWWAYSAGRESMHPRHVPGARGSEDGKRWLLPWDAKYPTVTKENPDKNNPAHDY
jgi:hypothetical protein